MRTCPWQSQLQTPQKTVQTFLKRAFHSYFVSPEGHHRWDTRAVCSSKVHHGLHGSVGLKTPVFLKKKKRRSLNEGTDQRGLHENVHHLNLQIRILKLILFEHPNFWPKIVLCLIPHEHVHGHDPLQNNIIFFKV